VGSEGSRSAAMNRPIYVQRKGRRTEIAYKAQSPGKLAPRNKTQGSGDRVNAAVVQRKFTFLSGEACLSKVRAY
jgi:hypothetical protein